MSPSAFNKCKIKGSGGEPLRTESLTVKFTNLESACPIDKL